MFRFRFIEGENLYAVTTFDEIRKHGIINAKIWILEFDEVYEKNICKNYCRLIDMISGFESLGKDAFDNNVFVAVESEIDLPENINEEELEKINLSLKCEWEHVKKYVLTLENHLRDEQYQVKTNLEFYNWEWMKEPKIIDYDEDCLYYICFEWVNKLIPKTGGSYIERKEKINQMDIMILEDDKNGKCKKIKRIVDERRMMMQR